MTGRAALVVEDGQDLTACYAIEPASVNISRCYRLWHVFSPLSEVGFTGFKDFQDCGIGVRNPSHNRTTTNYSLGSGLETPPTSRFLYPSRPSAFILSMACWTATSRDGVSGMSIEPPVANSETNHRSSGVPGFRWTTMDVQLMPKLVTRYAGETFCL